jgi:hypothetical protein
MSRSGTATCRCRRPAEYTVFDDESDGPTALLSHSRVVTVRLNLASRVATLVKFCPGPRPDPNCV